MPCRDWDFNAANQARTNLKKRNDELAKEACDLRALILELSLRLPAKLDPRLEQQIKKVEKTQRKHREADRNAAIEEVDDQIASFNRTVEKIKNLGGNPTPTKMQELQRLKDHKIAIMNADPLRTTLF